nr:protein argonaute 1 [Tanacetum cinerariifolium]
MVEQVHKDHKSPFLMFGCKMDDGYGVVQMNDTHLALCIPELMKILIDVKGISYMSSTAFIEPLSVIEFVTLLLNMDTSTRSLCDSDRAKTENGHWLGHKEIDWLDLLNKRISHFLSKKIAEIIKIFNFNFMVKASSEGSEHRFIVTGKYQVTTKNFLLLAWDLLIDALTNLF